MWSIPVFQSLQNDSDTSLDSDDTQLRKDILDYNSVLEMRLYKGALTIMLDPRDKIFTLSQAIDQKEKSHFPVCYVCSMLANPTQDQVKNCMMCGRLCCGPHLGHRCKYPVSGLKCVKACDICYAKIMYREAIFEALSVLDPMDVCLGQL